MSELEKQNQAIAKAIGCAEAVGEARSSGAGEENIAVAMDVLDEGGIDAFVAFLSEQTNGRYPPRGTLLPRSVPKEILDHWSTRGGTPFEVRRSVWWDCVEFDGVREVMPYTRLFGNANVGNLNLTNLQVAGSLTYDAPGYLGGWSMVSNAPDDSIDRTLRNLLADGVAKFMLGDRLIAERRMSELYKEAHPIECGLPVRQNTQVELQFFGGPKLREFNDEMISLREQGHTNQLRLWVNLEGWRAVWHD
jgi:hypothetical protein